jgi:hypothetical protein
MGFFSFYTEKERKKFKSSSHACKLLSSDGRYSSVIVAMLDCLNFSLFLEIGKLLRER